MTGREIYAGKFWIDQESESRNQKSGVRIQALLVYKPYCLPAIA